MCTPQAGGALGTHLELLLRAVLSKMQNTASLSVMQSLLLVFAYLLQTELEAVLKFLSQVPDSTGQSALSFIVKEWLTRHVTIPFLLIYMFLLLVCDRNRNQYTVYSLCFPLKLVHLKIRICLHFRTALQVGIECTN